MAAQYKERREYNLAGKGKTEKFLFKMSASEKEVLGWISEFDGKTMSSVLSEALAAHYRAKLKEYEKARG